MLIKESTFQIEEGAVATQYEPPVVSPDNPQEIHSLNDFDLVSERGPKTPYLEAKDKPFGGLEEDFYKINLLLDEPLRSIGDVKDRLYVDAEGTWKIERNIAESYADGTENWVYQNNYDRYDAKDNFLPISGLNTRATPEYATRSSHYAFDGVQNNTNGNFTWVVGRNPRISHKGIGSAEELKSYLKEQYDSGTPVTWIYQVEPTTETLPDELQDKLNNIASYADSNYVYTIIDGEYGEELSPVLHGVFKSKGWYKQFTTDDTIIKVDINSKESLRNYIENIQVEQERTASQYKEIYNNTKLPPTQSNQLLSAKNALDDSRDKLIEALEALVDVPGGESPSEEERVNLDSAYSDYANKVSTYEERYQQALDSISDEKVSEVDQRITTVTTDWEQTADSFEQSIVAIETDLDDTITGAEFNTIVDRVDSTVQRIGNTEGDLTRLEASIDGVSSTMVRDGEVINSINQSPEAVTIDGDRVDFRGVITVAQEYADLAVRDIDLGGVNLLRNSTSFESPWDTHEYVYPNQPDPFGKNNAIKITEEVNPLGYSKLFGYNVLSDTDNNKFRPGTFTLTFWAKADTSRTIEFGWRDGDSTPRQNINVTTEWDLFEIQFTTTKVSTTGRYVYWYGYDNLTIAYPKLERGNKSTDWDPAPEDEEERITKVEDNINNAVTTIDRDGITVSDGSFFLEDNQTNTKYSTLPGNNLINDHSFEIVAFENEGDDISPKYDDKGFFYAEQSSDGSSKWATYGRPRLFPGRGGGSMLSVIPNMFGRMAAVVNRDNFFYQLVPLSPEDTEGIYTLSAYFRSAIHSTSGRPRTEIRLVGTEGNGSWLLNNFDSISRSSGMVRNSATVDIADSYDSSIGEVKWLEVRIKAYDTNWVTADGIQLVRERYPMHYSADETLYNFMNGIKGNTGNLIQLEDNVRIRGMPVAAGGSSPIGEYTMYYDGTLICWVNEMELTFVNSRELGSRWYYPVVFKDKPSVMVTRNNYIGATSVSNSTVGANPQKNNSTIHMFRQTGDRDFSSYYSVRVHVVAVGRWK